MANPLAAGRARDLDNWFFDSYDLDLAAGEHLLCARVWSLGHAAPRAQISLQPGFLCAPDDRQFVELLATGVAPWEAAPLDGYSFSKPFDHDFFSIGWNVHSDGRQMNWGLETGGGRDWAPAVGLHVGADAIMRNRYPRTHLLRRRCFRRSLMRRARWGNCGSWKR